MPLKINNSRNELVIDPQHQKERYEKVRDKRVEGINPADNEIILSYLRDMELGRNVEGTKGARSHTRLLALRSRLKKLSEILNSRIHKALTTVSEEELFAVFKEMRDGTIKKPGGGTYKSVADYVKIYKAFWHWHMKVSKREGNRLIDITEDFDTSREKHKFNYFTFEQMKKMAEHSKYEHKVIMWFLFDTGIRAPTELLNVKIKDLIEDSKNNGYQLDIRDETSKTFGRKIKLMLCSELLKRYIKEKELKHEDFLFSITPAIINKYLKRIGERILGIKNITMYDFRHSSCCYWLPRYKNESALKYRFGWKKTDMIHYYSEFLGMKDTICQDDMIDSEAKTILEKELDQQKSAVSILQEQFAAVQSQRQKDIEMIMKLIESTSIDKETFEKCKPLFQSISESFQEKRLAAK